MVADPGSFLVGNHVHPDNLANQWLLPWAVDAVLQGAPLLHTTDYFWPVGDAPLLSGDGTQAALYAPFHLLFGWPAATPVYVGFTLFLNGLCAWFAARSVTRAPTAAWIAVVIGAWSPFVTMELSAGRFSQAAIWPLALFLGLWWRYLAQPRPMLAVLSAVTLAYTAFSYWYYGWFGVMAGAVAWLATARDHTIAEHRAHVRQHLLFSSVFLALLAPWAWLFVTHWASVPGAGETLTFPPESAYIDRLPLPGALLPGNPSTTAALWSPIAAVLAGVGVVAGRTRRPIRAWLLVGLVFVLLAWGPLFSGAPYTILYGLTAALRRFWWPIRHVVVVQLAVATLASLGVEVVLQSISARRAPVAAAILCALFSGTWWAQGAPLPVEHTPLEFPPEGYDALAALPEGVVVAFPLAPEATGTNDAMLHQLAHDHPMVTGHSPWVARARPAEWDRWVASQPFLQLLVDIERNGWAGGPVEVAPESIDALRSEGVRWLALDRTLVPLKLKALVAHHDRLFDALFGRPVIRTSDLQVWDLHAFTGSSTGTLPAWRWPSGMVAAGPEWPLAARRPDSPMLGTPSSKQKPADSTP